MTRCSSCWRQHRLTPGGAGSIPAGVSLFRMRPVPRMTQIPPLRVLARRTDRAQPKGRSGFESRPELGAAALSSVGVSANGNTPATVDRPARPGVASSLTTPTNPAQRGDPHEVRQLHRSRRRAHGRRARRRGRVAGASQPSPSTENPPPSRRVFFWVSFERVRSRRHVGVASRVAGAPVLQGLRHFTPPCLTRRTPRP